MKDSDWEPPRKERILLELLSVDETSSSSETREMSCLPSSEILAAD